MDTKSDGQFLVIDATIEANKQYSDNTHKKTDQELTQLTDNLVKSVCSARDLGWVSLGDWG